MGKLVFGVDRVCADCNGAGGVHAFHVIVVGKQMDSYTGKERPIRKHAPCTEHPCPHCGGRGVIR